MQRGRRIRSGNLGNKKPRIPSLQRAVVNRLRERYGELPLEEPVKLQLFGRLSSGQTMEEGLLNKLHDSLAAILLNRGFIQPNEEGRYVLTNEARIMFEQIKGGK